MEEKVYVLDELYNNDGEIESNILCVSKSLEVCQKKMKEQIEVYKSYDVYSKTDFKDAEKTDTSFEIYKDADDYFGKLCIREMKLE